MAHNDDGEIHALGALFSGVVLFSGTAGRDRRKRQREAAEFQLSRGAEEELMDPIRIRCGVGIAPNLKDRRTVTSVGAHQNRLLTYYL
jgi:hypothetical protein